MKAKSVNLFAMLMLGLGSLGLGIPSLAIVKGTKPINTQQDKPIFKDHPGTVNGAINPELIPEAVAYELLFQRLNRRTTSGNTTDSERMGEIAKKIGISTDELALIRLVADDFKQRISGLDHEAKVLKDRHWPDPSEEVITRLRSLQIEKEDILGSVIASLPSKLEPGTMGTLSQFVNGKMKQGIKLHDGPSTLPNGKSFPKKHH